MSFRTLLFAQLGTDPSKDKFCAALGKLLRNAVLIQKCPILLVGALDVIGQPVI
jgi:hypothetical protein